MNIVFTIAAAAARLGNHNVTGNRALGGHLIASTATGFELIMRLIKMA